MNIKKHERIVEVYVGETHAGHSGEWWTMLIPVHRPYSKEFAKEKALKKAKELLCDQPSVAFIGIYSVWNNDDGLIEQEGE